MLQELIQTELNTRTKTIKKLHKSFLESDTELVLSKTLSNPFLAINLWKSFSKNTCRSDYIKLLKPYSIIYPETIVNNKLKLCKSGFIDLAINDILNNSYVCLELYTKLRQTNPYLASLLEAELNDYIY